MATYTTNYNLDKYEGSDRPNLRDQYNAAMDKIDTALHNQSVDIASAASVARLADAKADDAKADAYTANGTAQAARLSATEALTTARAAQSDATTALDMLDDAHFTHIPADSIGTSWTRGTWATGTCTLNGFVIDHYNTGHGLFVGHITASSSTETAIQTYQEFQLARLTDWTVDTTEGAAGIMPCTWGSGAFYGSGGISICSMSGDAINIRILSIPSGITAIGANHAVSANLIVPVVKKS